MLWVPWMQQAVATEHNLKLAQLRAQLSELDAQQAAFAEEEEDATDYGNLRIESATFITTIALVTGMAATNLVWGSKRS